MRGMMYCAEIFDQTQSAFDLGYYEIMDGADMRAVFSGFYRVFLGLGDLYRAARCVVSATDLGVFALFFNQLTNLNGNDFMAKVGAFGQTYQAATGLWSQGYYHDAGSNFIKGLIEIAGGPIPMQTYSIDPVLDAITQSDSFVSMIEAQEQIMFTQKVAGITDGILYALTGTQSVDNLASCVTDQKRLV
jgi:hypothetical protein